MNINEPTFCFCDRDTPINKTILDCIIPTTLQEIILLHGKYLHSYHIAYTQNRKIKSILHIKEAKRILKLNDL